MATVGGAPPASAPGHPGGDARLERLEEELRRHGRRPDALVEVLHAAQGLFGFLPADVLAYVARGLSLPLARVYGVASFYHLFRLAPRGAHTCTVCVGTACQVDGAERVLRAAERTCGVAAGGTSADGGVTVEVARCIGACGVAPAVVLDGELAGRQTEATVVARLRAWGRP
jgi:bidirectional [NiFe] hydrogenase diaphorase subunit